MVSLENKLHITMQIDGWQNGAPYSKHLVILNLSITIRFHYLALMTV